MNEPFSDAELQAFLDESLTETRSVRLEESLRTDDELRQRLIAVRGRSLAGLHTIGGIWRRHRLSCPQRDVLSAFQKGQLDQEETQYVMFHLADVGCRICQAQLDDLASANTSEADRQSRRQRFSQSGIQQLRSSFRDA
ncbi:MAG: hypothetical protein AAF539_07830 [Planctomycetota bacterium]